MKGVKVSKRTIIKPYIITCGRCGGELHVIPIKNGQKAIKICRKCTFEKEAAE